MCKMEREIFLVGIGMGTEEGVTVQARRIIRASSCLIGAQRMLDCAQRVCADAGKDSADAQKPMLAEYRPDEIVSYIEQHPEYRRIAVLLSGDTGFYSGAKRLAEQLTERFREIQDKGAEQCRIELIPGISSVVYLAAKLNTSWLLGGQGVMSVRKRLLDYRMDHVTVHAGSRLSYEDERIISGKPSQISEEDLKGLCTVLIENPCPERSACAHVSDEDFIRGNVPMTKEEVRAVSIARLRLTEDAVVWDVGAGTGSVSVEAARSGDRIRVYAVEKNPDAVELIRENRKKFRTDGIRVISGRAPEALGRLEAPTHVFIGGSSGNLREILICVLEKNRDARIVINAISLETVKEVMEAAESGLLRHPQITQVSVARSRELGRYHMMTGQNPVYIISAGGAEDERGEA